MVIDEAGMADTLTLDRVVQFVTRMGGSVRLIGDDQQLAAIGAGGILRDIKHTHGALQLTELHRFTHPAEAAASLALRDGDPAVTRLLPEPRPGARRRPGHHHPGHLPSVGRRPGGRAGCDHARPHP